MRPVVYKDQYGMMEIVRISIEPNPKLVGRNLIALEKAKIWLSKRPDKKAAIRISRVK